MAFMIPETIAARPGESTAGERKVFVALRDHLPEDYLVYYDIAVKGRHPDFIVVGPDLGLVVLEVKDWRLDSIVSRTGDGVVLRHADGDRLAPDPVEQARAYVLGAVDKLKAHPLLFDGERLRCGWGYAAVFSLLKHDDVQTPSLFGPTLLEALGPSFVLTADDLGAKSLLPRLRRLVPGWAASRGHLDPAQMDAIRGVLYPEIRIGWGHTDAEIFDVMNREQERLARTLGEGHRLLRGVAGSGKTVVVIGRARYLRERYPAWRILVLCFNRVLGDYLREAIGVDERLDVMHFHRWCRHELERAGVAIPPPPAPGARSDYWDVQLPRLLLRAYDEKRIASGTYQAIVVDEGQDFADDWYRAVLSALDPATNSLFIAMDSSQTIYRRRVSWKGIGVQVVGHIRVLRVNYRNTRQILAAAYSVIQDLDAAGEAGEEYLVPERALREGPMPQLRRSLSAQAARQDALDWIRRLREQGTAPEEILVLCLDRAEITRLETWLEDAGIPTQVLGRRGQPGAVRLSTVHSAKGLDADAVLFLASGRQLERRDETEARRLLYIAMTRARTELHISSYGRSPLMAKLEAVLHTGG